MNYAGRVIPLVRTVQRCTQGDAQSATNELATLLSRFVWNCLGRFPSLGDADRQDLCQEICVQVLREGVFSFRGNTDAAFLAFARTCAVNAALNHFRRSRDHTMSNIDDHDELMALSDPAKDVSDRSRLQGVVRCARELIAIDHEIFWMRVHDWKFEQIAQVLNLPLGTVAAKEHRARRRIESCLERAGLSDAVSRKIPRAVSDSEW